MKKTLAIIAAAVSMASAHADSSFCAEGQITGLAVYLDDATWGPTARKTFVVIINGKEWLSKDTLDSEPARAMFTMALSAQSVGQPVYVGGSYCSTHQFTTLGIRLKSESKR